MHVELGPDCFYRLFSSSICRQEVDMAAAAITITEPRQQAVNFSIPWASSSISALVDRQYGIDSAEELLASDLKYGTIFGSSTYQAFERSEYPPYNEMWVNMQTWNDSHVSGIEEGLTRVAREKYAFFMESYGNMWWLRQYCSLEAVDTVLPGVQYGFAFPRGSQLIDGVNMGILSLREAGRIEALHRKWFAERTQPGECNAGITLSGIRLLFVPLIVSITLYIHLA